MCNIRMIMSKSNVNYFMVLGFEWVLFFLEVNFMGDVGFIVDIEFISRLVV